MTTYKLLLREFFSESAEAVRSKKGMTQEEMAECLRITSRAYGDLERGKYSFSATALIFFLLMMEPDEVVELLEDFRGKVYTLELQDAS